MPPFAEGTARRLPLLMTWLTPHVQAAMGSQAPDQMPVLPAWICSAEPTLEPLGQVTLLLGLWPPPEQMLSHATSTHILQTFAPLLSPGTGRTAQSNPENSFSPLRPSGCCWRHMVAAAPKWGRADTRHRRIHVFKPFRNSIRQVNGSLTLSGKKWGKQQGDVRYNSPWKYVLNLPWELSENTYSQTIAHYFRL